MERKRWGNECRRQLVDIFSFVCIRSQIKSARKLSRYEEKGYID